MFEAIAIADLVLIVVLIYLLGKCDISPNQNYHKYQKYQKKNFFDDYD